MPFWLSTDDLIFLTSASLKLLIMGAPLKKISKNAHIEKSDQVNTWTNLVVLGEFKGNQNWHINQLLLFYFKFNRIRPRKEVTACLNLVNARGQ